LGARAVAGRTAVAVAVGCSERRAAAGDQESGGPERVGGVADEGRDADQRGPEDERQLVHRALQ
jgi:hypothetical protein